MRRAAKVDKNHREIVNHLKAIGAAVLDVSQLKDAFDILVGYRGRLFILEIKNPEYKPKTLPAETMLSDGEGKCRNMFEGVRVPYHIVFSAKEAQAVVMGEKK